MICLKIDWKKLLICLAVPLAVGGLSALLTREGMQKLSALNQPPLSPPGWVFTVVWTVLFTLMGVACYLAVSARGSKRAVQRALYAYGAQLAANFLWSIVYFNLEWRLFAFFWLLLLWALIFITQRRFSRLSKPAGLLLLPYLAWVAFAGYLNLGVALLN